MFSIFFRRGEVDDHGDATDCDMDRFVDFFGHMLRSGVYMAPSQYEAGFLSTPHASLVDDLLERIEDSIDAAFA
jgi:glutamate-1-semialdehyde 2,1-aminomutase